MILDKVTAMQNAVKGRRLRRKVAAFIFGNANAAKLKECCDDLDWAMKEFDVSDPPAVRRVAESYLYFRSSLDWATLFASARC